MKNYWFMILLLAGYCLAFPNEGRAQAVYANSGVVYYEPTNSVLAYTEAWPDYPAELYYCLIVYGPVYKDGVEQAWLQGNNYPSNGEGQCGGWATADTWLPYDPNAEYEVITDNQLETSYRTFDESGAWSDYFNFSRYSFEDPLIYAPISFGFSGGSPSIPNVRNIFLGTIYSIFTEGATSGPPDHLKVVSDDFLQGSCGNMQRFIKYRVVDSHGKGAGGTYLKEVFPGTITDSCAGGTVTPGACSINYTGQHSSNFTDVIRTGCPSQEGACGFTINPNKYAWCSGAGGWLATFVYNVRWSFVSIDSNTSGWPAGKEFYP